MATGSYGPIEPHSPQIYDRGTIELPEKASQTFKKGVPLVLNGGYLEEAGATPSTIAYISAQAGRNGATDGVEMCLAYRVVAGDQWRVAFEDSLAIADNGGVYGIVKDATTGYWFVDDADSGDQVFVVRAVQTPQLGAVGDTKWLGIVEFQTANIAGA
jgi:hypothetical protein